MKKYSVAIFVAMVMVLSAANYALAQQPSQIVINPVDDGYFNTNFSPVYLYTEGHLQLAPSQQGVVKFPTVQITGAVIQASLSVNPISLPLWDNPIAVYGYQSNSGPITSSEFNTGTFLGNWNLSPLDSAGDRFFDVTQFMQTASSSFVGFQLVAIDPQGVDDFASLEYNNDHPSQLTVTVDVNLMHTFTEPVPSYYGMFGYSIAGAGQDVLIGCAQSEAAYLFNGVTGQLTQKYIDPNPDSPEQFGYKVAVNSQHAVVLSPWRDGSSNTQNSGKAYLFEKNSGQLLQTFRNPTLNSYDWMEGSIAIAGDKVVVGAPYFNEPGITGAGIAYVFDRDSGQLLHSLRNPTPRDYDCFGWSVGTKGNDILVGGGGKACVFDGDTGELKMMVTDPQASYSMGVSMAALGNDILVGDCYTGAVYLFDGSDGSLLRTFINPNHTGDDSYDYFGWSVSSIGKYVLIGALSDDTAGWDAGAAYMFDGYSGELVKSFFNPNPASEPTSDEFGISVACLSGKVAISAPYESMAGYVAGAVYVFEAPFELTTPVACIADLNLPLEAQGPFGAKVTLDGSCSSDADSTPGTNDDINDFNWYELDPCNPDNKMYLGSGQVYDCNLPLGTHTISLAVTDKAGATDSNEISITVQDTTPPKFNLSVSPTILWPANHKMIKITPACTATDLCDPSPKVSLVDITANEPCNPADIRITPDGSAYLCATRSGNSKGRIYTLTYKACDSSANCTTYSATVTVPHDNRK